MESDMILTLVNRGLKHAMQLIRNGDSPAPPIMVLLAAFDNAGDPTWATYEKVNEKLNKIGAPL